MYLTPREAQAQLRRLLEHEARTSPTPRSAAGKPVAFADSAEAWLRPGERKRNLKRSTIKDYRQALDAYLLPAPKTPTRGERAYGRARFASTAVPDLSAREVKRWYDSLPYGRTAEKLLMIVHAILAHTRAQGWIDHDPSAGIERQAVRYSVQEEPGLLFVASLGEKVAALGGHLELVALFPDESVTLSREPGPDSTRSGPSSATP